MKKLDESKVIQYFKHNTKICLNVDEKIVLLDTRLKNKSSIMRRLCYLVNECGWTYNWFTPFISTLHPQRIIKIQVYCNSK